MGIVHMKTGQPMEPGTCRIMDINTVGMKTTQSLIMKEERAVFQMTAHGMMLLSEVIPMSFYVNGNSI